MQQIDQFSSEIFSYAFIWFFALMAIRTGVILRRGYKVELATAKGSPRRGVLYSLTFSMLPWKKDSTRRHPWTYLAGMGMHVGVLCSIVFALGLRFFSWPSWAFPVLGSIAGIGFVSALGLFLKRTLTKYMRAITNPDDYISNLLVQYYLLTACAASFFPEWIAFWRLGAVLLLFYVPLGKIYHMVLFFVSRTLFGMQFGRRGVLQHDLPISY